MNELSLNKVNIGMLKKVAIRLAIAGLIAFLVSTTLDANILGILKGNGVKIVPGLSEALSITSTVYGIQGVFLAFLGVTVAPWLAAFIAGVGAVGT